MSSSYTLDLSQELQQDLQAQVPGTTQDTAAAIATDHEEMQEESTKRKKLPIIVDVALDANGKQLYQIHESSKLVRKEMPRSTNFNLHHELTAEELSFIQNGGDSMGGATASSRILDQNANRSGSFHQDDYYTHSSDDHDVSYFNDGDGDNGNADSTADSQNNSDLQHINKLNHEGYSRVEDTDIWSEDVEQAFEEVLTFIPKNGLNKIKIAGRSCGRNELISDYIFTKTGKFRTRKQVSSHIQVIKNLKQNQKVIDLINNGPKVDNEQDQAQVMKKFESVFSKINLSKSLGFSNSMKRKSMDNEFTSDGTSIKPVVSIHPPATKRRRKSHTFSSTNNLPELEIGNFCMSINNYNSESIALTIQKNSFNKYGILKHLKLNDNATISHRFPGMAEFQNCPHIPVLHNMARIYLPQDFSPKFYDIGSSFSANYTLKCKDYNQSSSSSASTSLLTTKLKSKQFSIFTCIYSYGQEVSKYNQTGIQLNQDCRFITNFWKPFIRFVLMGKSPQEVATALRGLSIKQIVYESNSRGGRDSSGNDDSAIIQDEDSFMVLKSRVKLVLLWEFSQVYDLSQAITTTTKIILPGGVNNDHLVSADDKVVPQVVTYDAAPANEDSYACDDEGIIGYDTGVAAAGVGGASADSSFNKITTSTSAPASGGGDHFGNLTAATTATTTSARPFSKGIPMSNPEYGPDFRYAPQLVVNDAHLQQQAMDSSFANPNHPFHHAAPQPAAASAGLSHNHYHPDYEIQLQQQVPVHYQHPHPGYKLHQSANMDLMMIPTGSVPLEATSNVQEYQHANQGFVQGYASDY
ncbi:hypothetical protein I9W82_001197 [Candida metapsilosis]|uniref:TEA domain-containing protein n=1 Tax=Candida metapsilosis TaxID=273372 RepID=A0A8H8DDM1_9ASCO|nr:hypothetical protein I9W82_001197 [Candida metapsilosis]